jgi:2-polyprenyl-3-methyl-5-hydroxy-6-metoxy-1,4-benzoquinol methylase
MDDISDPLDVAVAELSEYFKMSPEDVRHRCIHWEDYSVEEWKAKDRSTVEGLTEFYHSQTSWIFDTMWYHAQQYHGEKPAESINIVHGLGELKPGHHLDYGSGPGTSSLFFHELGWDSSLADISTSFLDFARWRLNKHGVEATFYDTNQDRLPAATFDLITMFDVIVHIPDVQKTLKELHQSLKPGGYLVFNIDNQPMAERTAWHLYSDQFPILRLVRGTGFKRHPKITYFHVYQKIEQTPLQLALIRNYDRLRYNRYVTSVGNIVRSLKRKLGK